MTKVTPVQRRMLEWIAAEPDQIGWWGNGGRTPTPGLHFLSPRFYPEGADLNAPRKPMYGGRAVRRRMVDAGLIEAIPLRSWLFRITPAGLEALR